MKVEDVLSAVRVAEALGGVLVLRYRGDVMVSAPVAKADECSFLNLSQVLMFLGPENEDGPDWEYHSLAEGKSLGDPRVVLEDGSEINLAMAIARLVDRATTAVMPKDS